MYIAVLVNYDIRFLIFFLEGRSDGESVLKLVQQLKPRRVIVVRGSAEKIQTLVDISRQVMAKNATTSDTVTRFPKFLSVFKLTHELTFT